MDSAVSEKQLAANQTNAKGGGVKTPEGKAISKHNALRHGILSREAVIRRGDLREDEAEYAVLRDQLLVEVQPVGIVELMLTDKLLTLYWRERRLVKAERGLVESFTIGQRRNAILKRKKGDPMKDLLRMEPTVTAEDWRKIEEETINTLLAFAEMRDFPLSAQLIGEVRTLGKFTEFADLASQLIIQDSFIAKKIAEAGKESWKPEKIYLDLLVETIQKLAAAVKSHVATIDREEIETDEAAADVRAIPFEPEIMDRIQRYETHLHRTFLHTLHELQRVQSVRLGKPSPLVAALDVTVSADTVPLPQP
ncbi:MAG: hypothetical protein PHE68_02535 [Candidatus Peribacteraceae bacterium]|nr:hypothetical protein [Candidatus Peribacteraceae bacterium]